MDFTKTLNALENKVIAYRRDFHAHPETGWTEFRTTARIIAILQNLGWDVAFGAAIHSAPHMMGKPEAEYLHHAWQRAHPENFDPTIAAALQDGFTGCIATMNNGPGPVIALRFDIDALDIMEDSSDEHLPHREGFASQHPGVMHACGHDCHSAIGLGLAELFMAHREHFPGTIKLIFQPAEEGVRGALSLLEAGAVEGVDICIGHHVYSGWALDEIAPGMSGYIATQKFDATFIGEPAHAGGNPQGGNNAMLAAANAVLNLHAIPRHSDGATRVNVGKLTAGSGRNVICSEAKLIIETRGETNELSDYMYAKAQNVLQASAAMYNCALSISPMGSANTAESSPALEAQITALLKELSLTPVLNVKAGGSEDFTYLMHRVQKQGGQAINIGFGADIHGHSLTHPVSLEKKLLAHTYQFDVDERVLKQAMTVLATLTYRLCNQS
jgi:aminobenzoyl-glutamate utilization protein A